MKKIMILDVEGMSTCKPYNIGYMVVDRKGGIYKKESYAILPCLWENIQYCFNAREMTHRNAQEILKDIENKTKQRKYIYTNIEKIKKKIINTIDKHNIKEIWAYNCPFDKGSLKRLYGKDFEELEKRVEFKDILTAILHTKLLTKKYIDFCIKNGYVTEKKNIMSKAEIVHRYLTGDLNFTENHTGLLDCEIEYMILLSAFNTHKKIVLKSPPAWVMFKDFCKEKNIVVT